MKDIGIKVLFVVILIFSLFLLITGIFSPSDNSTFNNSEILEEDVQLSTYLINMKVGETYKVTSVIVPYNATYKNLTWTSGNPSVVTVNNGLVTAIGKGSTIIKVASEKTNIVKIINVTVTDNKVNITKINILEPTIELFVGDKKKIEYTLEPPEANNTDLSFITNNKDIAGFDVAGNIVGVNEGTAVISLKSSNGVTASVNVTVKERLVDVSSIKVDKGSVSLSVGSSEIVIASVLPENASNKSLTWASSNNNIATVSNGRITGISEGTATIKVTSHNGKYKEIKVTVNKPEIVYPSITDNSIYHSGTSLVDSYNSNTLKYRIQTKYDAFFVLVWVKDPYKQWNSSNPKFGTAYKGETNLNSLIATHSYQNKGLVATNGSFFLDGWGDKPCSPFVISEGKILRDIENKKYSKVYSSFGMTKDGYLKSYSFSGNSYSQNLSTRSELLSDGVRSNFTYVYKIIDDNGNIINDRGLNRRTVLCQVNRNNFVIYSGSSLRFNQIGSELKNKYGCKVAYNLDGGGSRKLFYKTSSMASPKKLFAGTRPVADMMYFVEQ